MISLDPSKQVPIRMRKATAATFKIIFKDGAGDPFNISAIDFRFRVQRFNELPIFTLGIGTGLTIGGAGSNELTVAIPVANNNAIATNYFYELINETAHLVWLNGDFIIHTGKYDAPVPADVEVSISDTSDTISVTITSLSDIDGGTP